MDRQPTYYLSHIAGRSTGAIGVVGLTIVASPLPRTATGKFVKRELQEALDSSDAL